MIRNHRGIIKKYLSAWRSSSLSLFILWWVIFIFIAFPTTAPAQEPMKIRLDPAASMGGELSSVFKEVRYIPLETTKQSLFGRIDQFVAVDNYFVILDYDTNSILVFLNDGRFHARIQGGDRSKKFHPKGIWFFAINRRLLEISYSVGPTTRLVYDIHGKLLREEESLEARYYECLGDDRIVYSSFRPADQKGHSERWPELTWHRDSTTYKMDLYYSYGEYPSVRRDYFAYRSSPFYGSGSAPYLHYTRLYDYNVYRIDDTSLSVQYQFVFPRSVSLPQDFVTNPDYEGKRFDFVIKNHRERIYSIDNFYTIGDKLFFSLLSADSDVRSDIIFDLSTLKAVSLSRIIPDQRNGFLPLKAQIHPGFLGVDEQRLYLSTSAPDMFAARQEAAAKKPEYDSTLQKFFAQADNNANPVIIQAIPW